MRKPLSSEAPGFASRPLPTRPVLADLNLKVVTPMFGGGVQPRVVDTEGGQIIRPSAIRGHLRFWWRACNAARFVSLEAMHREERLLWGSATKKDEDEAQEATWGPGLIGIDVVQGHHGTELYSHQTPQVGMRSRWEWRRQGSDQQERNAPDYVLFPFTAEEERDPQSPGNFRVKKEPDVGRFDVTFNLRLTVGHHAGKPLVANQPEGDLYPDVAACEEAAAQALWAWIAFGGVGSRTRRGCGSLYCTGDVSDDILLSASLFQPPANRDALIQWLRQRIDGEQIDGLRYVPAGTNTHPFAMLAGCRIRLGGDSSIQAMPAWNRAINPFKDFLQKPDLARNPPAPGGSRPGESWWPEVSSARRVLNQIDPFHENAPVGVETRNGFPKADLGLPRLIKVLPNHTNGTPLQGAEEGMQRLASPIVLKALVCGENEAYPLAIELRAPHVWDAGTPGVAMRNVPVAVQPWTSSTPEWPFTAPKRPPRAGAGGVESARDAFMRYLHLDRGWDEVAP